MAVSASVLAVMATGLSRGTLLGKNKNKNKKKEKRYETIHE